MTRWKYAPDLSLMVCSVFALSAPAWAGEGTGEAPNVPDEPLKVAPAEREASDAKPPPLPEEAARPETLPEAATAPTSEGPSEPEPASLVPPSEAAPPEETKAIEVTVIGTRVTRTAGSAHVVRTKELERFEYDDPQAVLSSVPGVYARGEDGIGLRPNIGLRGVNSDRSKKVTLMEDGVLFGPAPYSAPAAYYFPLTTRMTQVRVIKGPGAISFGPQTVGGAVDYVTRPVPGFTSGAIDLGAGQYGYRKLHAHFGNNDGKTAYVLEGVLLGNDGFKRLDSGGDTGMQRNEVMWKGSYHFDPVADVKNRLELKLTYSDEISNETYLGIADVDFRVNPRRRYDASKHDQMKWHRTAAVLTHLVELSPKLSVTTTAYRHDLSRTWRKVNGFVGASLFDVLARADDPSNPLNAVFHDLLTGQASTSSLGERLLIGPNQRDFVSQGIQSVLRFDASTGPIEHRIEAGARLHYDSIRRRHTEDAFLLDNGQPKPAGTPTALNADNQASTVAGAFHVADALTWKETTLTPGVRMESIHSRFENALLASTSERSVNIVLPGIGLYQGIGLGLGVLLGVHRGFSPPPPGSARSTRPEDSVNYEGGLRLARGRLQAEVIGFYNDYSNLTDVCTLSSGCLDVNLDRQYDAGKAGIWGVENYLRHEVKVGTLSLPLALAYTYTRTRFAQDFMSDDPIFGRVRRGDEIPYVPRHALNLALGVEHARGALNLAVNHVSAMREQAGSAPLSQVLATDAMTVLDASASVRVTGPVFIYCNLRNLLNEQVIVARRPFGARPNAPRWLQLGIRTTF